MTVCYDLYHVVIPGDERTDTELFAISIKALIALTHFRNSLLLNLVLIPSNSNRSDRSSG